MQYVVFLPHPAKESALGGEKILHIALRASKKGIEQKPLWLVLGGIAMRRLAFIALIAVVVINTPAATQDGEPGYKALVEVTSHQVSVNRDGTGFRQVEGITPVDPGDLVMASADPAGHAWIIYPDCDVEVLPGRVYTVENRAGVVQISDAKEHRPICRRAVPWWLLAAPLIAVPFLIDDDDDRRRREEPASP